MERNRIQNTSVVDGSAAKKIAHRGQRGQEQVKLHLPLTPTRPTSDSMLVDLNQKRANQLLPKLRSINNPGPLNAASTHTQRDT